MIEDEAKAKRFPFEARKIEAIATQHTLVVTGSSLDVSLSFIIFMFYLYFLNPLSLLTLTLPPTTLSRSHVGNISSLLHRSTRK